MTLKRWVFGLCALLVGGLLPATGDGPQSPEPPLRNWAALTVQPDSGGRPRVDVGLPGGKRGLFVFDTGASGNLISPELARRLGLISRPLISKDGRPAQFEDGSPVQVVDVPTLDLAGLVYPGEKFALFPNPRLRELLGPGGEGVIGVVTVCESAVVLDLDRSLITLWYPGSLTAKEREGLGFRAAQGLPLVEMGARYSYGARVRLNDQHEETLFIDTGAPQTVLSRRAARILNLPLNGPARTLRLPFGEDERKLSQLESLRIGDQTIRNLKVQVSMREEVADMLLGIDVLSQLRVLLDYADQKVYVAPRRLQ
jgi:predicted aspartyl protease